MGKAFSYLRTSSSTNVGDDKDSDKRQLLAINEWAARNDVEIVGVYYDAKVKGAEPITARPGFTAMLTAIAGNGVRTICVENAGRFARDLIVQETGYQLLREQGITLIAVDDPDAFTLDTPTSIMIRQILGAVSEFEKASIVAKLKGARDRKRAATGRCEGPKPAPDAARDMAMSLRPTGLTLRAIASRLAQAGHLTPSGNVYGPASIAVMLR